MKDWNLTFRTQTNCIYIPATISMIREELPWESTYRNMLETRDPGANNVQNNAAPSTKEDCNMKFGSIAIFKILVYQIYAPLKFYTEQWNLKNGIDILGREISFPKSCSTSSSSPSLRHLHPLHAVFTGTDRRIASYLHRNLLVQKSQVFFCASISLI